MSATQTSKTKDESKTESVKPQAKVEAKVGLMGRIMAWANAGDEDRKDRPKRRSVWSIFGETAATAGAILGIYLFAMYAVALLTPNAMMMIADVTGIELNSASPQAMVVYWLAPGAVLLSLIVVVVVVVSKAIWRVRGRLVHRLRHGKQAEPASEKSVEGRAPASAGRAVQRKTRS